MPLIGALIVLYLWYRLARYCGEVSELNRLKREGKVPKNISLKAYKYLLNMQRGINKGVQSTLDHYKRLKS